MNTSRVSRIMLGVAAAACVGIFAAKLAAGSSAAGSFAWIAAALLLGVLAIALRPKDEKAGASAIAAGAVMVAALMLLSYSLAKLPSRQQETELPEPTAAPAESVTEAPIVTDTPAPTETPIPTHTPVPTPTETPAPEETEHGNWIYEGMYKVGADIPAGEYYLTVTTDPARLLMGLPSSGYFEVASDSSGTLASIVSNGNFQHHVYLTVYDGEYLTLDGCNACPSILSIESAMYSAGIQFDLTGGMYKAGTDFPPGEYKVICDAGESSAYYEVAKNSRHTLDSIISNDNFSKSKYVTIKEGQYILLKGCHINIVSEP